MTIRTISRFLISLSGLVLLLTLFVSARAQEDAPCGVVDAIEFPIDDLRAGHDDFGLFRSRFGGRHTGLDIGFGRWGDPVRAAARGRVTYSDPEGWDTEKGVVILEHVFPDGSVYYTLYGHMEQSDTLLFPPVGACLERGAVLGGIGWPSRGRPHLHYEVRDFLPNEGGPGYVEDNPLLEGWLHPLDFTYLWRIRLQLGYVGSVTFDDVPSLPPVALDSGQYAYASSNAIVGASAQGDALWRVEADGVVTGLAALSGDQLAAHTRNGQVLILQGGRYAALWSARGPDVPFVALGETLVFVTQDGGLAAFDALGQAMWTLPGIASSRVAHFGSDGASLALGLSEEDGVSWRLVSAAGEALYETVFESLLLAAAPPGGAWLVVNGGELERISGGQRQILAAIEPEPGEDARMAVDALGNSYVYLGDGERTLLSFGPAGEERWRIAYPGERGDRPPVLALGGGCLLYALDDGGTLNVFGAQDGALLGQRQLYAGGTQSHSPNARFLSVDAAERVQMGAGFLSMVTLDGWAVAGVEACVLG